MALVVLLRGVNVGGHRTFRPSALAKALSSHDVVPRTGPWLLRIVALTDRIACGEYRRDMKTAGYLGQIDKLFGVPVTTRNWNTVSAIARILRSEGAVSERSSQD